MLGCISTVVCPVQLQNYFNIMTEVDEDPFINAQSVSNDEDIDPPDEPPKATLRALCRHRQFCVFLPWLFIVGLPFFIKVTFISAYGAAWFGGCKTIREDDNCDENYDFSKYVFWNNLFLSIGGLFVFLSAGIVGRLSDSFGRKKIFYIANITAVFPFLFMTFFDDFFIFFGISAFIRMNGLDGVITAYVSDSLPKNMRLFGYGIVQLVFGIGLFVFVAQCTCTMYLHIYVILTRSNDRLPHIQIIHII